MYGWRKLLFKAQRHSMQLLENIRVMILASFCSLMKSHLQLPHQKTRMTYCTHMLQVSTTDK